METHYVYFLASKRNGTLYIGFTKDLDRRIFEHKFELQEGFTKRYGIHKRHKPGALFLSGLIVSTK